MTSLNYNNLWSKYDELRAERLRLEGEPVKNGDRLLEIVKAQQEILTKLAPPHALKQGFESGK